MVGDHLEFDGTVIKAQGNGLFLVKTDMLEISCTLSGKIRKNTIKVLEGDIVKIKVSPYDLTRGFITYRMRNK